MKLEEAIDDRVSEIEEKLNEVIRKVNKGERTSGKEN